MNRLLRPEAYESSCSVETEYQVTTEILFRDCQYLVGLFKGFLWRLYRSASFIVTMLKYQH